MEDKTLGKVLRTMDVAEIPVLDARNGCCPVMVFWGGGSTLAVQLDFIIII